jgi:hypothetical protein
MVDPRTDLLRGIVTLSPISGIGGGSAAAGWAVGFLRGLAMTPSAYSCESEGILRSMDGDDDGGWDKAQVRTR